MKPRRNQNETKSETAETIPYGEAKMVSPSPLPSRARPQRTALPRSRSASLSPSASLRRRSHLTAATTIGASHDQRPDDQQDSRQRQQMNERRGTLLHLRLASGLIQHRSRPDGLSIGTTIGTNASVSSRSCPQAIVLLHRLFDLPPVYQFGSRFGARSVGLAKHAFPRSKGAPPGKRRSPLIDVFHPSRDAKFQFGRLT